QTPVVGGTRVSIGLVAAKVVQLASHGRQTSPGTSFGQRRSGSPGIRGNVVFPNFIGDRTGMMPLETTREPNGIPIDGRIEMGEPARHILLSRPGVGRGIVDV